MLSPAYLSDCASGYAALYSQLDSDITADIARRLAKTGKLTYTARWQMQKLKESQAAYAAIAQMVKRADRDSYKIMRAAMLDGCSNALEYDDAIYRMAGKAPTNIASSLAMQEVMMAGINRTQGVMSNMTGTTANTATHAFENSLDRAYMQVISGAYSPDQALRQVVNDLGKQGYQGIAYPSGKVDHLDVAARRAMITGLNQTTAELQLMRADEMECDLVEVTAHAGARPTHAEWQGQIYSRSGKHPKYADFYASTDYGAGDGLCGWNCYHSFYPYFEGVSAPTFGRDPSAPLGKSEEQVYEESQEQRYYERQVREARRECVTLNAAMEEADDDLRGLLRQDFTRASVKLKRREATLSAFCQETNRTEDRQRLLVYGFNRSVSGKAVWANRKAG